MFLGISKGETILFEIDNAATVLHAGSNTRKFSTASKHFKIDEKYVTQAVEQGVVTVKHKSGKLPPQPKPQQGFDVDAMTKVLPAPVLDFYFDELQGR